MTANAHARIRAAYKMSIGSFQGTVFRLYFITSGLLLDSFNSETVKLVRDQELCVRKRVNVLLLRSIILDAAYTCTVQYRIP